MELCSLPSSSHSQSRFNNDRRMKPGSRITRHPRLSREPPSSFIIQVAMGDFKGPNPDNDGSNNPRKPDYEEYASKKKLEMMGSLLKEGYGVGALVTAGLIKGVSLTTDFLKQISNRNSAIRGSSVRRYGNLKKLNKKQTLQSGTKVTDTGRNSVSDSLTSSVTWSKHETPDPEEEEDKNQGSFIEEQSLNMEDLVLEQDPPVFEEEEEEEFDLSESIQDAVLDDPVFQNEMEDTSTTQSTESTSTEEFSPTEDVSEQPASIPVKDEEDKERLSADPEASSKSDNIESFSNKSEEVETTDEENSSDSVAFSRAMEILDSIASFEEETGESVDDEGEMDEPQKTSPPTKPRPSSDEIRAEMQQESKKRLRAIKKENRNQRSQKKPVNVVKPSKRANWKRPSGSSVPSGSTAGLKGLDYIKSYAKERQGSLGKDRRKDSVTSDSNSAFFKPPSILQGSSKVHRVGGSASGSYSRWNEVQRLQKVREIGTVLWLGKGGGNGGNNGGNGGGGRRDGSSNDGSEDKDWWIQVGVSLLTMSILVFTLLTTIANHVEKRNSRIKKHP